MALQLANSHVPKGAGIAGLTASQENKDILQLGYSALDLGNLDLDAILADGREHWRAPRRPPPVQEEQAIPVRASANHSFAHGPGLVGGRCGDRLQFTVTVVREDGRVCQGGAGRVAVHVAGLSLLSKAFPEPRPWIEDVGDGSYLVQYICATPGDYHVHIYVGGIALPMCPASVRVTPGPPSAFHCDMSGVGTQLCQVGEHSEFTIHARDEFGNSVGEGGHRFGVRAVGHAKLHEVTDNEDGTYIVCYSLPEFAKGPVKLEVLLEGVPLKGSPLEPEVQYARNGGGSPRAVAVGAAGTLQDSKHIQWLQESQPYEIPELPEMSRPHGDAVGDDAASRTAWRTADEWRRLKDMRDEMARAREALVEHQAKLAEAGTLVHRHLLVIQEKTVGMQLEQEELGKVEQRLQALRGGILRQHRELTVAGSNVPAAEAPPPSPGASPSPGGTRVLDSGLREDAIAAGALDSPRGQGRRRRGLLNQPPPPPAPPPAITSGPHLGDATRPPTPSSTRRQGGGASSAEELGKANRRIFHAFASQPAAAKGPAARNGQRRMGMGLQDYLRMAKAAQIRLASQELEDAFQRTVLRYGGSATAEGERTLAFELFVELLMETARRRYGDVDDTEATGALFEEHLLPLSRQLAASADFDAGA